MRFVILCQIRHWVLYGEPPPNINGFLAPEKKTPSPQKAECYTNMIPWVVSIDGFTMVLSVGLAQLFDHVHGSRSILKMKQVKSIIESRLEGGGGGRKKYNHLLRCHNKCTCPCNIIIITYSITYLWNFLQNGRVEETGWGLGFGLDWGGGG